MEIEEVLENKMPKAIEYASHGENGALPFTSLNFLRYHIWRAFSNTPPGTKGDRWGQLPKHFLKYFGKYTKYYPKVSYLRVTFSDC